MEQKINLLEMSFLIPVRIDSVVRLENLLKSIECILRNFETNIYVLEAAPYNNGLLERLLPKDINYLLWKIETRYFIELIILIVLFAKLLPNI